MCTKCVENPINNHKNCKATCLDGMGYRILKAGIPVLIIYLPQIFNCSLAICYVPNAGK